MLADLVARMRQIERRSSSASVVAAKVSRPVTNVTEVTEVEEITNNYLVNKSCSAVNLEILNGWTTIGVAEPMEWAMQRADAGYALAADDLGVEVAEAGWYRVTASIYSETDEGAIASGRITVNGVAVGGAIHLGMDEDPYNGGAFFDNRTVVAEVDLETDDVVGFALRAENTGEFDTPAGTSTLVVEKV